MNGVVSEFMSGLNVVRLSIVHCFAANDVILHWTGLPVGWPEAFSDRPQLV